MRQYTDSEKNQAKMLIRFFNMQAGKAFRCGDESKPDTNIGLTLRAIDKIGALAVKEHIRNYCAEGKAEYRECISEIILGGNDEPEEKTEETPDESAKVTEKSVASSLGILEQAVAQIIAKTQADKIEAEIMGSVEDKVRAFIKEEYGTIERRIITVIDDKRVPMHGIQHEKFEKIVKYVANDEPVLLTGSAGSGKNVLCKQVAEALGLKFYFTNAVTQEYKLTGFTDAMGNYQPTQFYKAFTEGGLFMLDEMDASIPEVLVILNAAIANRYFDFPAPIGYREAHPDFRVIAAGNTTGQGASYEYVGRNQLDAASLDRFAVEKIDYSEAIENSVAGGDLELANFCREFRKAADHTGQKVIVSYRGIGRLAKMSQIMSLEEALEGCLVKGMEKDDVNVILAELRTESKYKTALKNLANRM